MTRVHARRFDGNSWGPSVLLAVGESPRVAADQAGNFMVLFRASGSNTSACGELHCRYYNDGWSLEQRVNVHDTVIHARTGNDNHDYLVSASGTGRFVALYKPCVAGNVSTALHARTFEGSKWGVEQVINVSPDDILSIDLAASVSGTAIAVWCQRDVSAVKSICASHYDGADWSVTPTRLSMVPDGFFGAVADVVDVTVDAEGNGIALIRQCADVAETNTMEVFKIHFNAKAGWDLASRRPLSVLKDDMNECSPQVAGNGYGEAVVIWGRRDTGESFSRFFGQ